MRIFSVEEDHLNYNFTYHLEEKKNIQKSLTDNKKIELNDLRRIALWKYDRIIDVEDCVLENLFDVATSVNVTIDDIKVHDAIKQLTSCEGVGFPLASSILKFINPDVFPIIDIRAYRAIYGKKIYSSQYNIKKYVDYTKQIYQIRDKFDIPLEEVDERLYMFDKQHNGKL